MDQIWLLNMSQAELEEAARLGMERLDRASVELAEQGWSLPMSLTPAETYEILNAGTPAEIDALFVRLYDDDEGRHFERLTEGLLNRDALFRWRILLEQTVSAYRRREFGITIPALLAVCEGLLMHGEGNCTDLRGVVCKRLEAERHKSLESIDTILWKNIHRFIEEIFKRSDFAGTRPSLLNRHWILHGRDAPTWNQADCLRLLQAIDTILVLSDDGVVQRQA